MHLERDGLMSYGFYQPTMRIRLSLKKGLSRFLVALAVMSGSVGFVLVLISEYANREYDLTPAIIVSLTIPFVVAIILEQFSRIRTRLHDGSLREFFATENDFSYQLMFADTAMHSAVTSPEIAALLNEFFAQQELIQADMAIRDAASRGFGGLVDIYLFRQLAIEHLKRLDKKSPGDYWRSVHAKLEQELDDEYAALLRLEADMATTDLIHPTVAHGQYR